MILALYVVERNGDSSMYLAGIPRFNVMRVRMELGLQGCFHLRAYTLEGDISLDMSPLGDIIYCEFQKEVYSSMRDRNKTKEKILDAVGALLAKTGFSKLGVNTIAREAGVDKVLIYRYFGGLPQLLRHFAAHGSFWPGIAEHLGDKRDSLTDLAEASITILQGYLKAIRKRPVTLEIMRWELYERNELIDEVSRFREQQGMDLLALIDAPPKAGAAGDFNACAAIIHAGLSYLALRAKTADTYLGIDLTSDKGWQRIHNGIAELVGAYVERLNKG